MKKKTRRIPIPQTIFLILLICILLACALGFILSGIPQDIGADKRFDCDVKSLNLNTSIEVQDDNITLYTIKGNVLRLVTDPLSISDANGNTIGHADDSYHLVNQDSHMITVKSVQVELVGDFNVFGDSYKIYQDGTLIATAKFNMFNTHGTLKDVDGNIIADYTSRFCFNDFIVQVKDNNLLNDESILLIMGSYYSDQHADNN